MGEQGKVLKQISDLASGDGYIHSMGVAEEILPINRDPSRLGLNQPREAIEQCSFAGAGSSKKNGKSRPDCKISHPGLRPETA